MKKLFLMAFLPIIALVIYSSNYLTQKYSGLQKSEASISKLNTLQLTSNLIHELQIERGVSVSILNNVKNDYFSALHKTQTTKTDTRILQFTSHLQHAQLLKTSQTSLPILHKIKD